MITIAGPFATSAISLTIPNAELNNGEKLPNKIIVKQAMSGRMVTTIRTATDRKLTLTLSKLSSTDVAELQYILANIVDLKLTLMDASVWRVRCLSNPLQFTQGLNYFSCNIEFQGIKQ